MSGPFVLAPLTVTAAMISSSTITEPAASETAWNAATTYTLGTEVILTSTHRVYENLIPGLDSTSPDVAALQATPKWLDKRPTLLWAAFDAYVTTASTAVGSFTYVLRPGIFNAISFYGLSGATITVSIKTAVGGTVFYTYTAALQDPPVDYYDYYFGVIKPLSKLLLKNITPYGDPEVTITVSAGTGVTVSAGMILVGDLRLIVTVDGTGGTQYGAKAKPTTTSLFIADGYGGIKIVRRTKATDMDFQAVLQPKDADLALQSLQDVLDVPAAWIATDAAGYAGLNVFGLASGDVTYLDGRGQLNVSVKGLF